ncbi:hypothetical protein K450DRAFT_233756 [Umbelopsis ramanniana AG]|uniref:Uncharacterized protein n=1 Tax=Umbelopsis ramanniana AG TaxID=1314678 RepID=A0AAD5HEB0_UMBRA|nr:uncharacterized protein K450DRAFT_233756 [Umbelopsis ramanniana AG]KAI8581235.1 hypothetical protein K450DRAFT_233756 [Umbelopsis ramanniana AG]
MILKDGRVLRNGRLLTPEASASPLSSIMFNWMNPFLTQLRQAPTVYAEDLWALTRQHRAKECHRDFECVERGEGPFSLLYQIYQSNRHAIWFQCITSLGAVLSHYSNPYFLDKFLQYIEDPAGRPLQIAYLYCLGMFAGSVVNTLFSSQTLLWGRRCNVRMTNMLNAEIYAKSLRRKDATGFAKAAEKDDGSDNAEDTVSETTTGKITNLMSVDAERLAEMSSYIHIFYSSPFEILFGVIFLYRIMGTAALFGLTVMIVSIPLHHYMGKKYHRIQERLMTARDRRTELLNELLHGIRMVKAFAWERKWEEKILRARNIELDRFVRVYIMNTCVGLVWFACPVLVTVVSFLWYTKVEGHELTASTAFVSIVLFGMIRDPLNVIPEAYMSYIDAKVSLTRISDFLSEDERGSDRKGAKMLSPTLNNSQRARCGFDEGTFQWHSHLKDNSKSNHDDGLTKTIDAVVKGDKEPTENDPLLPVNRNREDATSYSSSSSTLTAITYHGTNSFVLDLPTMTFPSGKLTIIFGSTGSGKSSLLNALLGEMDAVTGRAWLPSKFDWNKIMTTDKFALDSVDSSLYMYKVAYAAQQPWIQHASIRDNIVFGQPFDELRYNKVLYQCALVKDLDILEDGDLTEIGEKGINLSGGQKQRVSLARAVYSRAKTVLLDDCLSAVDANTASHLYEKCLLGDLMHDRTIILVSHHVRLCLGGASYLVQMNRGQVIRHGNVEDLRNNGELAQIFGDDDIPDHITEFVKNDDEAGFNDQDSAKSYAGSDVLRAVPKKLIEEEVRQIGKVKVKIYATYLLACGGLLFWGTLICFYVISRLFNIAENYWLKVWSAAYDNKHSCTNVTASVASIGQVVLPQLTGAATKRASTVVLYGQLFDKECSNEPVSVNYYISIYVWICFGAIIISLLRSLIQYYGSLRASRLIFHKLLISVCHAPMRFFDTTPVGRILNRFSKDMETIDHSLSWHATLLLQTLLGITAVVAVISAITPEFLFASVVIGIIYIFIGTYYVRASRELKRINSVTRSPIFSQFSETLVGVTTIRAYGQEKPFMSEMLNRLDENMRSYYTLWTTNRWLFVRVEMSGSLVSFLAGVFLLRNLNTIDAGLAGLSLSFSSTFLEHIYWLVRQYTTVEMHLNSVERVQEYLEMPQEPPGIIEDSRPPMNWPYEAAISVRDLEVSYSPDDDPVLRGISFDVQPREKVGIVGRTGSGKTTLTLSFLRFVEPLKGSIVIDGIDIQSIGVDDLRSKLTIIPQDAILFSGSIRVNLDPFDEFSDSEIWQALRRVHLVTSHSFLLDMDEEDNLSIITSLDTQISEGGTNFSQGQRQLLCMARALLRNSTRLIVMDEATSSVDFDTDKKIQTTIREEFADSTLLCIAHRLRTIIDYDKVLVIDEGKVVEYDTPYNLLHGHSGVGVFKSMCERSWEYDHLIDIANQVEAAKQAIPK